MFVVWTLLDVLVAWALIGALIGIAAALTKGFSVAGGTIAGFLLGPLAFLLFYGSGVDKLDRSDHDHIIYKRQPSRYAERRCPECTGPNTFLTWQGMTARFEGGPWGDFVPASQTLFMHQYRCIVCGYQWQFESPLMDPDKPPKRVY